MKYKLELTDLERKKYGFRYNPELGVETYHFSIFSDINGNSTLYCQIWTDDENIVHARVVDACGMEYHPYINREYGNNEVISIIDKKINSRILRLGGKAIG